MSSRPPATLVELLQRRADAQPEDLAFASDGECLTFGQLLRDARALAGSLLALGVEPGARVALALPAGVELARSYFAVQLAGAAPAAVAPTLPLATLFRRVRRLAPVLALSAGHGVGPVGPSSEGPRWASPEELRELAASRRAALPPPPGPDALAHLQLTSGTSGEPRAAMLTHRAVTAYLRCAGQAYGLSPADRIVAWVPPWHDMGLFYGILYPVAFGCEGHLVQPAIRTLVEWLATISRVRGTFTGAPDFAYRIACRTVSPEGLDLSSLRVATSGGEPVRRSTVEAFEERFGVPGRIRPAYGLAEASLGVSVAPPGAPLRVHASGAVSCGPPMPGVEVRIAPDGGREAARCQEGEILVRSDALFAGYLGDEDDTRLALRGGWLHTGDSGLLDEAGELVVLGRRRALLKRAGSTLAPREVEEAAESVDGVRLAAAVGDEDGIVVVAETASAGEPAARAGPDAADLAADVAAAVRDALGFRPTVAVVAPRTIPRSENGKVQHERLRTQLARGLPAGALIYASAPLDPLGDT
jgi:acyl-CoA synthetase (AMP-forming)/AMP-acid ligase II